MGGRPPPPTSLHFFIIFLTRSNKSLQKRCYNSWKYQNCSRNFFCGGETLIFYNFFYLELIKVYTNDVITVENIKNAVKNLFCGEETPPTPPPHFFIIFLSRTNKSLHKRCYNCWKYQNCSKNIFFVGGETPQPPLIF